MYATDLEATSAKTSRASKLLASSQKPFHFSFSLFLFVTILVDVNDAKVNLRNGAFKIRGSTSYLPTQKKIAGIFIIIMVTKPSNGLAGRTVIIIIIKMQK